MLVIPAGYVRAPSAAGPGTCLLATGVVLKTQTPNLDLSGPAASFLSMKGLERLKPYPRLKNSRICFCHGPHVLKRRIKRICAPCLSLETKMSNQPGQCASGQHSGSTTRRPSLMLWMSKCVYSPLAEFGKQNVSSKQKRAFSAELCTTGSASLKTSAENLPYKCTP